MLAELTSAVSKNGLFLLRLKKNPSLKISGLYAAGGLLIGCRQ
jgi:hypothetical protein